jgi:hypothetical protein
VTIRQALFIAPCSHTFHYKCIKPLLDSHHPAFSCPLCRSFADLDEDVEIELPEPEYELLENGDDHNQNDSHVHGGGGSGSGSDNDNEGGSTPTPHSLALPPSATAPPLNTAEREGADTDVEGDGNFVHGPYVPRHTRTWPHRPDSAGSGSGAPTLFALPPPTDHVVDLTADSMFADIFNSGNNLAHTIGVGDLDPLSAAADLATQLPSPDEQDAVMMEMDSSDSSGAGCSRSVDALVTLDLVRGGEFGGEGRACGYNVALPNHHAEGSSAGLFEFGGDGTDDGEGVAGAKRKRMPLAAHTL